MNDSYVTVASVKTVLSQQAYILFYVEDVPAASPRAELVEDINAEKAAKTQERSFNPFNADVGQSLTTNESTDSSMSENSVVPEFSWEKCRLKQLFNPGQPFV
jgi:hypothetical protein